MAIQVGDRIPDVQLTLATPDGPVPVRSSDFFTGKRVALFAVPGAYTPTCSARHLPSFVEKAAELKAKGVDEIACTSVNDAFVMGAWNREQGSSDITMLADGNGELAEAVGLTMDGSKFGIASAASAIRRSSMTGSSSSSTSRRPANIRPPAPRRCSANSKFSPLASRGQRRAPFRRWLSKGGESRRVRWQDAKETVRAASRETAFLIQFANGRARVRPS